MLSTSHGLALSGLLVTALASGCSPPDAAGSQAPIHGQRDSPPMGGSAPAGETHDKTILTGLTPLVPPAANGGAAGAGASTMPPTRPPAPRGLWEDTPSIRIAGASAAAAGSGGPAPSSPSSSSSAAGSSSPATTTGMTTKPAAPAKSAVWRPKPGASWQWQLTGTVDTTIDVEMYDIDLFMNPAAVMQKLHADQRVVICYFSAGSYEPNRPDSAMLAATGLGAALDGWPDERWLDIRSPGVRDIMKARLDFAVKQGCDGVEPDNTDGFANDNGLGLTLQDQLDFNRFLAAEAHARNLSVGLKNTLDLIPQLVGAFDWALDEECELYGECASLQPFISAGKAVFHCEYLDSQSAGDAEEDESVDTSDTGAADSGEDDGAEDDDDSDDDADDSDDSDDAKHPNVYALTQAQICAGKPAGFSTIIKNLTLDAYRVSCN